ncbi:MAG: hypothetical protein ACJ75R_01360 [Solirubrobacterales bacterium]
MKRRHRGFWIGTGGLVAAIALAGPLPSAAASSNPTTIKLDRFAVSPPVRDLPPSSASSGSSGGLPRVNPRADGAADRGPVRRDPLSGSSQTSGRTPAPLGVFEGTSNPTGCGTCTPPDTTGDVGPANYVQMVNATKVAIFNTSGALLAPPFDLSTLFASLGGDCAASNDGDPQVVYDPLADRWILAQFAAGLLPGTDKICFAVSQTGNPQGAYFLYAFTTPEFPDYFKVGVWPTGYYVGTNETSYTAYAFDRAKMLAGDSSASGVRFPGESNFLMPASVVGTTPPPTQGGLFYTFKDDAFHGVSADQIDLFQLTPNFAAPGASTFTQIATLPTAPFTYTVCGFFNLNCIPQPGTAQNVDAVSEWPMQRFAYRSFADHQALVGNFTVGGGSSLASGGAGAAIRWFELRNSGAAWSLFQQGTQDPGGGLDRFMGSISIDTDGNIALGYSASSSTVFPNIRYATRTPADPPGTLEPEVVMQAGGGSQTSTGHRWGDYSAMAIDPVLGCTFWYTNEFYPATATNAWHTAIGTFRTPGCPSNAFQILKVKHDKKHGTATITVSVPHPGTITLSGGGLKPQRPTSRAIAKKPVASAGQIKLTVKAKGSKKKKLNKKGKVKAKAKITYTPTGGTAATQTKKLKLKKKLKHRH